MIKRDRITCDISVNFIYRLDSFCTVSCHFSCWFSAIVNVTSANLKLTCINTLLQVDYSNKILSLYKKDFLRVNVMTGTTWYQICCVFEFAGLNMHEIDDNSPMRQPFNHFILIWLRCSWSTYLPICCIHYIQCAQRSYIRLIKIN